ncbi:MAG: Eco57I restriction-modification methylase domain-containing protein [Bryobacteraceae bacterium]
MSARALSAYASVRTEGALLPADILARIASGDATFGGLDPASYHLDPSEKIGEATNRAWNRLQARWASFETERAKLAPTDTGTTITRERWLLPLFEELKFGRLQLATKIEIDGKSYPVSHAWRHVPIHLVGCQVDLDRRVATSGAPRSSPHSLVQELLNRSPNHLWGIVSNGLRLRLLRDNVSLTRQAYVEFDLEAMMAGEAYPDFVLLWLVLHQSRFEGDRPELCQLEKWSQAARTEGVRVLDGLRDGVQKAIEHLGQGFLAHPANSALREKLRTGALDKQDYYRQLLRLVYRLLFLFVAEDRDLLLVPTADPVAQKRYREYYATTRLRRLASTRAGSRHHDLYCGLKLVMDKLSGDGCPELALPALGSFLFSPKALPDLEGCEISNLHLLEAIRSLAVTQTGQSRRLVDYKNLGAEELGSVYESLLELHPDLNAEAATFELKVAAGSERKKTGSYYTPTSLISCLLDSALDPVLDEAAKQPEPEAAILKLKVVDPACGSGHFLIAAAHRIAKRLAAVRTGEEEPPPEAHRKALRDVIGHCIYGVDLNPMAVELCKVSLWMEALEPGKPLSFLEHRIQCGNSLLGSTPALLAGGIPDEAFTPIEEDDKEICREFKRINRDERNKQMRLFAATTEPWQQLGNFAASLMNLDSVGDDSIEAIREKERMYEQAIRSGDYLDGRFWADAWCAAFVWKKTREFNYPITEEIFRRIERNPHACEPWMRREIERLAAEYRFFHWHLAFPDVFKVPPAGEKPENEQMGWNGGFHVVLGNPPWERIKLQEKEWFAARHPEIANAPNKAARERLIRGLRESDPALHAAFHEALRQADGESVLVRNTGRYPLCGVGDINTYAVFAECGRALLHRRGRMGMIVPSGIATDNTTRNFFASLVGSNTLVSLYDFENREGIFEAVDRRMKFSLLTITGAPRPKGAAADFFCFAHSTADLADPHRHFTLTAEDIALINPNTRTCPIFRTQRDAEITKGIYRRVPVLVKEGPPEENPWGIRFSTMFHMSNDSHLFRTREQLEAEGFALRGNHFVRGEEEYVPLYEAKMMHQYTHRSGDYAMKPAGSQDTELPRIPPERLADPNYVVLPRYWVRRQDLPDLGGRQWLLGFRDITNATNERTAIFAVLPPVGVGHTMPLLHAETRSYLLLAALNSLPSDWILRQSLGGTHLTFFIVKQLAVLPPSFYTEAHLAFLTPRVLELTYTAWDLAGFARDLGYDGPPFRWDEERRFLLRAELDALYFHLYGIPRGDVDYILDTFPIVRRKDEAAYGEYRTKRVILEIYDALAEAERTGVPYQTRLNPPPADPRVAHTPVSRV